jgi:hypothetical protein
MSHEAVDALRGVDLEVGIRDSTRQPGASHYRRLVLVKLEFIDAQHSCEFGPARAPRDSGEDDLTSRGHLVELANGTWVRTLSVPPRMPPKRRASRPRPARSRRARDQLATRPHVDPGPEHLRTLRAAGENRSGPLGPGLLASGQLGMIIGDLQAGLGVPDCG